MPLGGLERYGHAMAGGTIRRQDVVAAERFGLRPGAGGEDPQDRERQPHAAQLRCQISPLHGCVQRRLHPEAQLGQDRSARLRQVAGDEARDESRHEDTGLADVFVE